MWIDTAPGKERPPLDEDLRVDVVVVGAGIIGITTAHMLQARGKNVAVLEADRVLRGVTGHTTAKVTSQHGACYRGLVDRFGREAARLHGEANEAALAWIRERVAALDMDAALVEAPAYVYATDRAEADRLRQEADVARGLGLPAAYVSETELPFAVAGAVRFDRQAHLHPRAYLLAMMDAFEQEGGRVFEQTRVLEVSDGEPCTVRTGSASLQADAVVVATNVPINDNKYFVTRLKPMRAYGIAVRGDAALEGMYINASAPVRSVRRYDGPEGPMLLFVGENHPVGHGTHTEEHHRRLIDFAQGRFGLEDVAYRWSTQDFYPFDGLPHIGRIAPGNGHVWTATGMQGWGLTGGTVAAMVLTDRLNGREGPWARLYDPFSPGRVVKDVVRPDLLKQQAHVARMFVGERLRSHADQELEPGEGAVLDVDGERLAVHRDHDGTVHAHAAECTHMGCVVAWNYGEQSWDCPCHGSRFAGTGGVLHGPATRTLPGGEAKAVEHPTRKTSSRANRRGAFSVALDAVREIRHLLERQKAP